MWLSGGVDGLDAVVAGDDGRRCQPDEKTMLDHARNGMKSIGERSCIRNAAKRCIKNEMAAIGNERLAPRHPQCDRALKAKRGGGLAHGNFRGPQAEAVDLDR